jgi:hypothetical protein
MNRKNAFFQKHILNEKIPELELSEKIYNNIFGFTRIRKSLNVGIMNIIKHVIKKQKEFDYNYYISKNCPLPENWREDKKKLLEDAQTSFRGKVY